MDNYKVYKMTFWRKIPLLSLALTKESPIYGTPNHGMKISNMHQILDVVPADILPVFVGYFNLSNDVPVDLPIQTHVSSMTSVKGKQNTHSTQFDSFRINIYP